MSNQLYSQNTENAALSGKIVDVVFLYPLLDDAQLKQVPNVALIYPLLVINGIVIRDEKLVNYFRNYSDRTKITKIKHISAEKVQKMGIPNVPKDGVLFISTKKGYYFDFSCE
jgi:hypothetical protein